MKRSGLIVAMFVLVSLLFVGLRYFPEASATTLYVGGAGPGNYTAIQEAIDNAGPGDVIYVFSGTYNESIIIGTPITLVGEGREATTIDGKGLGDVISVAADNVSITEFTIKGESGHQFYEAVVSLRHVRNCYIAHND
ncbi:MAG: right-handed parallel beta-helix repeat-containing protein, partial [Candidatus Thorarchaeota archaeon]